MMLFDNEVGYVAVPKTATTSIESVYSKRAILSYTEIKKDKLSLIHMSAKDIKKNYNAKKVVGVIRNPLDWAVSKYNYLTLTSISFELFLEELHRGSSLWLEPYLFQYQYLEDSDIIITYENVDNIGNYLIGENLPLVYLNASKKYIKKETLTFFEIEKTKEVFKEDFYIYNQIKE